MKKVLFLFIAFLAITTTIYASFPVTEDLTEQSNSIETEKDTNSEPDWTLFLVCLFVGNLGIHRFMMGDITNFILMLLTFGGCGIWTLIDLINIATGKMRR